MSFLPMDELPELFPPTLQWVKDLEAKAVTFGKSIPMPYHHYANSVGVSHPDEIRIFPVPSIPLPSHPRVAELAKGLGLITGATQGMTAGYGILLRNDCEGDLRLLVHELVHVGQYERLGLQSSFGNIFTKLMHSGTKQLPSR